MTQIIEEIKQTLNSEQPFKQYIKNYPIKIVHEKTRIQENETLNKLNAINFFDQQGFSAAQYPSDMIDFLLENTPQYIECVSYAVSTKNIYENYVFVEKFPHDKWKKITADENLQAIIEFSKFSTDNSEQEIETQLRNIMRSRKEVPLLKTVAFIWIAEVPKNMDITNILQHYFLQNFTSVTTEKSKFFIAWNEQLQNINMRFFVYPPQENI